MILTVPSCGTLRVITTQVPMIGRTENFPYYEDENVQVVSLPLKNNKMQVLIILPKQMFGLAELERELTGEKLISYISALNTTKNVMVLIPKIVSRKYFVLSKALEEMGLLSLFGQSANFSGISDQPLSITKYIVSLGSIEINEGGIISKTVSSIAMFDEFADRNPIKFNATHPFLYAILDNQQNVLWISRYMGNEKASEEEKEEDSEPHDASYETESDHEFLKNDELIEMQEALTDIDLSDMELINKHNWYLPRVQLVKL
uniref:SERPIN domain-containing protein n=1 Tax=Elaeophora elaphi TaxID=1147741 RepID=A0A0R3RMK1_9BILA